MKQPLLKEIPLIDEFRFSYDQSTQFCTGFFYAFNTEIEIKLSCNTNTDYSDVEKTARAVFDLCRRYELLLSHKLEKSQITSLNSAAGAMVEVSWETWEALEAGKRFSALSEGCFDITMGAVTQLWDFSWGHIPETKEVIQALEHVDWRTVFLLDSSNILPARYYAQLADPQASVDLGGVAKGLIADKIGELLKNRGIACAFVNLGGNVTVYGTKPDGNAWVVGLRNPFNQDILGAFSLREGSVVTSGTYERCFEANDMMYHHILDPQTGMPAVSDIASVTIISKQSLLGDGLSTTLLLWGFEKAYAFVEKTPSVEAIFVKANGLVVPSKKAEDRLLLPSAAV